MRTLLKETLLLRSFSLFKIPLIFFLQPTLLELSEERAEMRIKLGYRSKNHLGSLYFGALCVGADCAGGIMAVKLMRERGLKFSMVFKDFEAQFLKRADGDTHFVCEDGRVVRELIDKAIASKQRENATVHVTALVPKKSNEPVAKFKLTLSVKAS